MQHPARQYAVPVVRQLLHQLDLVGDACSAGVGGECVVVAAEARVSGVGGRWAMHVIGKAGERW
jgi:hypothetical protein